MKPIYIHSGMVGAPQYANANDNIIGILTACLTPDGFNLRTATSASASGGVLTLNFASDPGFEALQTVEVAVSSVALVNGQHRVVENSNNQVTIAIPGLADGVVGSSGAGITIKQAGAGWSKPFSASTKAVFRPPAGNRRYLRVVNAAGADMQARGYEDMTDVDTGVNLFPTVAQVATPIGVANLAYVAVANAPWWLVATSKWVYFSLTSSLAGVQSAGGFFFGDISLVTVPGDVYSTVLRVSNGNGYAARNHAGAAGAASVSFRDSDGATATWPSVLADGAQFIPYAPVLDSTSVLRGVLPSIYKVYPHVPANRFLDVYSNITGVSGRMKPWAAAAATVMTSCIALDEEVWD
jgi:hypothetical protein